MRLRIILTLFISLSLNTTIFGDILKRAENGEAHAQYLLGIIYAEGKGVPQDDVMAYKWWNIAAAKGNEVAKKEKEDLMNRMTREQIAEAQKLSREWKPKANP